MSQTELSQLYQRHCWQPFTQMKLAPKPIWIEKGEGVYIINEKGERIIDAIGSWWVSIYGHSHPALIHAVTEQMEKIEHLIFAGLAHEPAVRLAQRLSQLTNHHLNRVFYSDNGSTAVEIALKMAYQYFQNQKAVTRQEFISLGGGYHGDTIGAMSVGEKGIFHQVFEPLLFPCIRLPKPSCLFRDFYDEREALKQTAPVIQAMETVCREKGKKICALVLEPLIQGASGGFCFYPPVLLRKLHEICQEWGIFLIADEVFTGSGRTGSFFACEKAGIWPDMIALSKGLGAGYATFGATLTTEDIYNGFYSNDRSHTFFHGHSMTANPVGCSASLAGLDLMEKDSLLRKTSLLEKYHHTFQKDLSKGPLRDKIREFRSLGSVGVVELQHNASYTSEFGWKVMQKALKEGVLLRPLGNVVYLTPPYCIKEEELQRVYLVMEKAVVDSL